MAKFILTIEALVEAPALGAARQQKQAMQNMLGNPLLKSLLESAGVRLVGYNVSDEIKYAGK